MSGGNNGKIKTHDEIAAKAAKGIVSAFDSYIQKAGYKRSEGYYINEGGDDFFYKGERCNLNTRTKYYAIFQALYRLKPKGGFVTYDELVKEMKKQRKEWRDLDTKKALRLIQRHLMERYGGVQGKIGLPDFEDNGRPLLETVYGEGINFNNKRL